MKKNRKKRKVEFSFIDFIKKFHSVDFYSALIFVIATLLILLNFFSVQTKIKLKVGDVAEHDIYAYTDLEVPDEVTTLKKKREAIEKTPNVYRYLSDKKDFVIEKINAISVLINEYEAAKKGLNKINNVELSALEAQKQGLLEKITSMVPIGEEYLPALINFFSNEENLNKLRDFVSYIYSRGLVENKSLFVLKNNEAILYDVNRNQEFLIRQKPAVIDKKQLKSLIKDFLTTVKIKKSDRKYIRDFLFNLFEPNYIFDSEKTKENIEKSLKSVEVSYLRKKRGEIIVRKGERVNEIAYKFIEQQNKVFKNKITLTRFLANLLILTLLTFLGYRLTRLYRQKIGKDKKYVFPLIMAVNTLGIIVIKGSIFIFGLVERSLQFQSLLQNGIIFFAIPFVFPVSLTAVLVDGFAALIVSFFLTVLVILLTAGNIKLVLFTIFSSITVIYLLRKTTRSSSLMLASLILGFFNFVIAFLILFYYGLEISSGLVISLLLITVIGSIFSGGLVSTFSPLFESMFKIVSDMKLSELSTMDNPLLKELSMSAPGTYQHSVRVANLAEAAAQRVGANALLVKVGAYYHDIGKTKKPDYFIENLRPGEENKHTRLAPKISALILKNHVKDGVDMAEEYGLPEVVISFIKEHHGTKLMTFFYNKALNMAEESGEEVVEEEYRYPGPKPSSKETAILMIADAIEAASRTLNSPATPGKIQHLVDRIVKDIIDDGQLSDSDLTFKELTEIKNSFVESLTAYFHTRVDYPGFDFNKQQDEDKNEAENKHNEKEGKKGNK
ncbi:metal-dependent phosphohydrolase [Thermotomaculum hydrothermale]|uniref:Metal-dependent phosphohydrolase n=1 Tax=Thermotomaculum hydrothermale TaxID=981385 RepID=A0A7R6PXA2_9BACT|nr:HDIG domain-containing metalloprotein [Thermotomaculum hydrothermale]BBB32375.1 metal-dependent phosphohydrolase [Thermotomaculum hydrothermale]